MLPRRRAGHQAARGAAPRRPLAPWLVCLGLAAGACTPPLDDAAALERADQLIDDGQPALALQLLADHALLDRPDGRILAGEAHIVAGDFDDALRTLRSDADVAPAHSQVWADACAQGALAALRAADEDLASARVNACPAVERIDLDALRFRVRPPDTLRAGPPEQRQALIGAWVARLRDAEPAPEVDVAAELIETTLRDLADAATDDLAAIDLRRGAFDVGRDPELGTQLIDAYMRAGEARMTTDPQVAATLFEHVYLRQTEGLVPSVEQRAAASRHAQVALYPIFLENFRARYANKFQQGDVEAGRFDPAAATFAWPPLEGEAGVDALYAWAYGRLERPRPRPTPDLLGWAEVCADHSAPCVFSIDVLARWAYYAQEIEREYAAAHGVTYTWPGTE